MPTYTARSGDVVKINPEQGPDPWTVVYPATPPHNARVTVQSTSTAFPRTPVTLDFNGASYFHPQLDPSTGATLDVTLPGETWAWVYDSTANLWTPLNETLYSNLILTDLKTTNYAANTRECVRVDSTAGDVTITLPANPEIDDRVGVLKLSGKDENVVFIDAGTNTIVPPFGVVLSTTSTFMIARFATVIWRWDGSRWFPEHGVNYRGITEAWSATPITGVADLGQTIQWTFVPLYTGQQPAMLTEAAGVFTAQAIAEINVSLAGEWSFVFASNNQDATIRISENLTDNSGIAAAFLPRILQPFSHTRADTFSQSGSTTGALEVGPTDTISFTAESDASVSASVNLDELFLFFRAS